MPRQPCHLEPGYCYEIIEVAETFITANCSEAFFRFSAHAQVPDILPVTRKCDRFEILSRCDRHGNATHIITGDNDVRKRCLP